MNTATPVCDTIFVKSSLEKVWRILTDINYIKKWDQHADVLKELHVVHEKENLIVWDIENNIDYHFFLTPVPDGVRLKIRAHKVPEDDLFKNAESISYFAIQTICRIKELAE